MYDLVHGNPSSVSKSFYMSFICELPGSHFLFFFEDYATVRWSVAATNIVDAMFILHLNPDFNDYQIAYELLVSTRQYDLTQ